MKHCALLIAFVAACGGKSHHAKPFVPTDPVDEGPDPDYKPPPPPEPPPPPPPKVWHAHADLAPVKGAKVKPATVTFTQTEGEDAQITTALVGLKKGAYHLVFHEASACGKNAKSIGAALDNAPIDLTATKGAPTSLDEPVTLALDGDFSIVDHTLVLTADKKGKPGKPIACGSIVLDDDAPAIDDSDSDD